MVVSGAFSANELMIFIGIGLAFVGVALLVFFNSNEWDEEVENEKTSSWYSQRDMVEVYKNEFRNLLLRDDVFIQDGGECIRDIYMFIRKMKREAIEKNKNEVIREIQGKISEIWSGTAMIEDYLPIREVFALKSLFSTLMEIAGLERAEDMLGWLRSLREIPHLEYNCFGEKSVLEDLLDEYIDEVDRKLVKA